MLTDANKSTLDLLALNLCDERRQGRWAEGAKVDLAEWDWRKPPPRCATMIPLDDSRLLLTHYFSATFRPFCAVFSPFFRGFRLPGAKTERTGEKWRKMGEIWGRNGREIAVAK